MSAISSLSSSAVKRRIGPHSLPKRHGLRKVVVLGAGSSKPFGLPLAAELLGEMMNWYQPNFGLPSLRSLFEFLDYFYPGNPPAGGQYPDAEDVLGMMDVALAYSEIRSRGRGHRWRSGKIEEVRSAFVKVLGRFIWGFQDTVSHTNLETLQKFVRWTGRNAIYVSFNYDLLLESALSLEGIPFAYGLLMPTDGVSIIKPHGSVNWFSRSMVFPPSADIYELGNDIVASASLSPCQLGFTKWKESIVVPPTPSKQVAARDLRSMWTCFSSAIHTTSEVIIVGYSLPAADRLARLVLRKAGPVHHPNRKILVVDPDSRGMVESVYRQNVSPQCQFVKKGLEEWVNCGCAG